MESSVSSMTLAVVFLEGSSVNAESEYEMYLLSLEQMKGYSLFSLLVVLDP